MFALDEYLSCKATHDIGASYVRYTSISAIACSARMPSCLPDRSTSARGHQERHLEGLSSNSRHGSQARQVRESVPVVDANLPR